MAGVSGCGKSHARLMAPSGGEPVLEQNPALPEPSLKGGAGVETGEAARGV